jgi:hypothetical protein
LVRRKLFGGWPYHGAHFQVASSLFEKGQPYALGLRQVEELFANDLQDSIEIVLFQ